MFMMMSLECPLSGNLIVVNNMLVSFGT